jgi:hypothetical protein
MPKSALVFLASKLPLGFITGGGMAGGAGSYDFSMTSSGYANTRFSSILVSRMTRLPSQASHRRLLGFLPLESVPTDCSDRPVYIDFYKLFKLLPLLFSRPSFMP